MSIFLLCIGLPCLVLGAELLVRGASRAAALAGISPLVIGLTVVAFGTSAPELAVNIQAAWTGEAGIAIGNVVGSNIFNVLFILGISALIVPLAVNTQLVRFDVPVMIGVSFLAALLAWNGVLSWWDGALLLALLAAYLCVLYVLGRRAGAEAAAGEESTPRGPRTILWSVTGILAGLVFLVLGARLLVTGAVQIAEALGVNSLVIGLTLVAAGTSLPELATSVVASLRGERDIAVGNVVGSNIFNILAVFGVAALIAPDGIAVTGSVLDFDLPVMIAVAVICMPIFISGMLISRFEGALFFLFYLAYTVLTVLIAFEAPFAPRLAFLLAFAVMPATAILLYLMLLYRPPASWYTLLDALPADVHHAVHRTWRHARRIVILVTGGAVLLAGAAMLLLPGPGIVTIALGLAILATEFVWARRFLSRMREEARNAAARFMGDQQ